MGNLILDYYKQQDEPFVDYSIITTPKPKEYWYPIESKKEVLIFGTRDLPDICAKDIHATVIEPSFFKAQAFRSVCNNADFLVGEIIDIPIDNEYDYVIVDNPKWYEIKRLVSYLKPDGKLLIYLESDQTETMKGLKIPDIKFEQVYYFFSPNEEEEYLYSEEEPPTVEEYLYLTAPDRRIVDTVEYKRAKAILDGNILSRLPSTQLRVVAGKTEPETKVPCKHIQKKEKLILPVDQDSELMHQVKKVQIELLKELKTVCDNNDLSLFLIYGSLLGAERHGGYILGDDDIDVALCREDYNKLLTLADRFPEQIMLQTPENDDCFYGGFTRLRDKRTTAIIPQNWWKDCCEGIFIDIFPLDYVSSSQNKERNKRNKILFLQRLLYAKAYGYFDKFYDMPLMTWKFYKYLGKPVSREKMAANLTSAMSETDRAHSNGQMCIYAHYLGFNHPINEYPATWFENPTTITFEGMEFSAPKDKKTFLTSRYGENYLQPSNWNEHKRRHAFYSTEEPYSIYKARFNRLMKDNPEGKRIILFGEKPLFEAFQKKYPNTKITDQVNIEKEKLPTPQEDIYAVICSADVRKAEKDLKEAGYNEYRIFWADRDWLLRANVTSIEEDIRNGY